MTTDTGIIHALSIVGDGSGEELSGDDISRLIKDKALAWVHLDGTNPASRAWLQQEVDYLDHLILDALFAQETRPRITEYEDGVLMILRGVNLNENAQPEDMISIRLWVDKSRIISVRLRPLKAVKDIQERLLSGTGPKNAGEFLAALTGRLFERMESVFSELDEKLDDIEEKILDEPRARDRQIVTEIRKQAIIFRRYIAPQKDVLSYLRSSEVSWLDKHNRRHLQETYDRVVRYVEDLDAIRERGQIIKDELATVIADKMNKNMYVLSVIAAIFLPLGFLTGLLGINVGGIPGADNGDAFMIFCGILSVIVVLQIILFRTFKWL